MLIKTNYYTAESGEKRKTEYYGPDEQHITAKIDSSAEEVQNPVNQEKRLTEMEALALDTNIKMDYLLSLAELRENSGGGIACKKKITLFLPLRKAVA